MASDDRYLVMMIQIEWWSRSSDDDRWWSRSSDDPDLVMMSHDDPDSENEDDLKTQKTWDADDEMIQLIQRRRPVMKIVLKEYLPS